MMSWTFVFVFARNYIFIITISGTRNILCADILTYAMDKFVGTVIEERCKTSNFVRRYFEYAGS